MRLASADLLQDLFDLDKDSLSPFALSSTSFPKVITVLDSNLGATSSATSQTPLAVRASSSSSSVLVSAPDIVSYLRALEAGSSGVKVHEIDFVQLKEDSASADTGKGAAPKAPKEKQKEKSFKEEAKIEGAKQIAIGYKKEVDFAGWYIDVLLKADMLDYYDISGCYILKPWSYNIWEEIQGWFNTRIKLMGVENSYFPMFVTQDMLEREKKHLEGFSPEVAWVTKA